MTERKEHNILVAKFDGLEYINEGNIPHWDRYGIPEMYLQYHSSWDWIMPVVNKIISTSWNIEGAFKQCSKVSHALNYVDIEKLFIAVVKFIQWYNEKTKPVINGND